MSPQLEESHILVSDSETALEHSSVSGSDDAFPYVSLSLPGDAVQGIPAAPSSVPEVMESLPSAAFQARAYEAAMDRAGSFVAAGNLFWLNVLFRASPKVVSLSRSVGLVAKDFFRVPTEWAQELQLTIAVMPEYVKAKDLMKEFGQLKAISPEEIMYGFLAAVAQDMEGGGGGGVAGMAVSGALHAHEVHCSAGHEGLAAEEHQHP